MRRGKRDRIGCLQNRGKIPARSHALAAAFATPAKIAHLPVMNRRVFIGGVALGTLAVPRATPAQPTRKVYRIGLLGSVELSSTAPKALVDEVVAIVSEFDPRVLVTLACSFAETDLRDMLSTIDIPTLLLYGNADTRAPLQVAEALHAKIRGSKLVVLSGVGHMSNVEAAAQFDTEVRRFLRSHAE